MPVYVYQAIEIKESNDCQCNEGFEHFQSIKEEPLSKCPKCQCEIRRVIQPIGFSIGKKHLLTDKNIKKQGFTKLVNEGGGKFRKI